MSDAAEKIRTIFDKAAVDALGKQLGRSEGTAHATITVTDDTVDVLIDFDPPSYLPVREPLRARIPDLCPDDEYTGPHSSRAREEFEKAAAEDMRQYLAHPENYGGGPDDGTDIEF